MDGIEESRERGGEKVVRERATMERGGHFI